MDHTDCMPGLSYDQTVTKVWNATRERRHPSLGLALLLAVEYCWNVFPSTPASSGLLAAAHATVFAALWFSTPPPAVRADDTNINAGSVYVEGSDGVSTRRSARMQAKKKS